MRKNSKQLLREIYLELELDSLSIQEREELNLALDRINGGSPEELPSLELLCKYADKSVELYDYIQMKLTDKLQNIVSSLPAMTILQFEDMIKELERNEQRYDTIREQVKQKFH